jgi:hypothetical protein
MHIDGNQLKEAEKVQDFFVVVFFAKPNFTHSHSAKIGIDRSVCLDTNRNSLT